MKKRRMRFLAAVMVFFMLPQSILTGCVSEQKKNKNEIVVFNYGDYIERELLSEFEEETGIKVKYEEFLTPEAMYTKFKNGTVKYDLICCSDYMLDKMIRENEVREIPFDQMKYTKNIGEKYWEISENFDPDRKYTLPYFWGTVGILYNTKKLDFVPDSWEYLWDPKFKDDIIMQDSVRDCFIPALILSGYSINTKDHDQLHAAQKLLLDQKKLVQSYLVDEARDDMANEQAAMAMIYSGEASLAKDYNDKLEYVVPKEGTNFWMDSWVIPKNGKNPEGAIKFLDFLCRDDIAMKNFDYVYYSTPNEAVLKEISKEDKEDNPTIFPDLDTLPPYEMFHYLGAEEEEFYNYMWKEIKAY